MTKQVTRIPVSAPGFVPSDVLQEGEGGSWLVASGLSRPVLYGPYVPADAGIWRIRAAAKPLDHSGEFSWDVYADGRIYAVRRAAGVSEAIVRLPDTVALEFRFTALSAGLKIEAVEMELVLADRDHATAETLRILIDSLSLDCDVEACVLHHLIERLAEEGGAEEAGRVRRKLLDMRPPPPTHEPATRTEGVGAAWDRFNAPGAILDFYPNERLLPHSVQSFVEIEPLYFLDISALDRPTHERLTAFGYRPDLLQATACQRDLSTPRRPWQTRFGYAGEARPSQRPAMFEALANTDLSYQRGLARGEGLLAFDPKTGQELRSQHGFVRPFYGLSQVTYRFEGSEVFYISVGNFPGGRMFIYFPRTCVVAVCEEPVLRWYPYDKIIKELMVAIISDLPAALRYLGAPTRPAAICGLNNLGHYFWNEIGGLHWAAGEGLLKDLQEVVKTPRQYVDAQEVVAELYAKPAAQPQTPEDVFRYALKNGLLPIRFSDAQITTAYAERLRDAAEKMAGPNGRPGEERRGPLIWINLRAHNKIWVDQAAGFAQILNALLDEHGAVSAYIDGTPDCTEIMADIRRMTRAEIPLYDGLNVSVFDSLNWAFNVDAYICTIGSGLALVSWLANKPGVAHAEHGHMQQMVWWGYARADLNHPLMPELDQIHDKGEGWYCDYEIDWQVLYKLIRRALVTAGYGEATSEHRDPRGGSDADTLTLQTNLGL